MKNNIFSYATSELSQDAVICWLLSWSKIQCKDKDLHLHNAGKTFLDHILSKWNIKIDVVQTIEIHRQLYNIDVIADINDSITLVIEDKIGTNSHSNQLQRYKDIIETNRKNHLVAYVYLKTHDFLPEDELQKSSFKIFTRSDMLDVFATLPKSDNYLLDSFHKYLLALENEAGTYQSSKINDWTWHAIQKFYSILNITYTDLKGSYVANPRGGFLGCWWSFNDFMNAEVFLQMETTTTNPVTTTLCFKIAEASEDVREIWLKRLIDTAKREKIAIEITPRRKGMCMTVAKLSGDCRVTNNEGVIDINETIKLLNRAVNLQLLALK